MITEKEVIHIAGLARINLSEKEIEKMKNELSLILEYIKKLKELDLENVLPTTHCAELKNITREDISSKRDERVADSLKNLAPQKEQKYIKTKSVF